MIALGVTDGLIRGNDVPTCGCCTLAWIGIVAASVGSAARNGRGRES